MKKSFKTFLAVFAATAAATLCFAACNDKPDPKPEHKHSYTSEVTKEATCDEAGVKTFTCECGDSYTEPIEATGVHTFDTEHWQQNETHHWHAATCDCDRRDGEAEHTYQNGVCSVCGYDLNAELTKIYVFEENGGAYRIAGLKEEGLKLTKLNIPARYNGKDVTEIKAYAFEENAVLKEVSISSTVTELQRETFRGCSSLEKVTLPATLTKIGDTAFAGCAKLTEINLPKTVKEIGAYAFDGCAALEEISLPVGLNSLGAQAFANCSSLKAITVPSAITGIGDNLFLNCSALATVTLHEDVATIGRQAFANCTSLTSIELPAKLTAIRQSAFKGSGLTEVTVPDKVSEIGASAFAECDALTEATLSKGVNYHFGAIFDGCDILETLTIPFVGSNVSAENAATTAFGYLFGMNEPENGSAFTKAGDYYIPNTLRTVAVLGGTVAEHAFDGCSHLETVHVESNVVLNAVEFTNCTAQIHVLGAPKLSDIAVAENVYVNEAVELTYTKTHGSAIEITVKKGETLAVAGTDYEVDANNTHITFKKEGAFTITVKATLNNESVEKTATVTAKFQGPELENVSLDKNAIKPNESVVLSYEIDSESTVNVTVKKGDAAAAEGSDYNRADNTFTFITAGTYTITVTATRNNIPVVRELTVAVADLSVNAPTVTFTADKDSVNEGDTVNFTPSVTYDTEHGDSKSSEVYEVFVQNGSNFENADAGLYELNNNVFKPLVAGTYRIDFTANSTKGQTATASVTVTAAQVDITLAWDELPLTNGWLRLLLNESTTISYTVTGYAGGYSVNYAVDNQNVSLSLGETNLNVSSTEINSAIVKVTYTHKANAEKKQELELKLSFVSSDIAPVLGEDPFGGTYGTLIPSTGLMLYHDVKDKDNSVALAYSDITYEIVATDLTTSDGVALDTVEIIKLYDMVNYPFILVKNFENNTATGTVTVKLTATKDGQSASATKVFAVTPLEKDSVGGKNVEGLNAYVDNVSERGAANFDKIMDFDQRQNMVVSKEGVIIHREWGSGNILCVEPNGADNFQLDFDYTPLKRLDNNNKVSFAINFRTGSWDGWCKKQTAFYVENNDTNITCGYWGEGQASWSENKPVADLGTAIHVRFTHTVQDSVVTFDWKWSTDGENYNHWLSYTVGTSTNNGNIGAPVYAMQFAYEAGSFCLGGMTYKAL